MARLYSETLLSEIKSALESIESLSGSKGRPRIVQRFDRERRRTAELPGIQVRRLREQHSNPGDLNRLDEQLAVTLPAEIHIYSRLDRAAPETYDELVADDVASVLEAIYAKALGWEAKLSASWETLAAANEEEPDNGAVINLTVEYQSPTRRLDQAANAGTY